MPKLELEITEQDYMGLTAMHALHQKRAQIIYERLEQDPGPKASEALRQSLRAVIDSTPITLAHDCLLAGMSDFRTRTLEMLISEGAISETDITEASKKENIHEN